MRELHGLLLDGQPRPEAFLRLMACMRYPEDEPNRRSVIRVIEGESRAVAAGEGAGDILDLVLKQLHRSGTHGAIAGEVLLQMLTFQLHRPDLSAATVNKCAFLVSRDMETTKLHNGRKAPADRYEVRKDWNKFKNVVHWWGAFRILQDTDHFDDPDEAAAAMISTSTALYRAVMECQIINDWDPWITPPNLDQQTVKVTVPPPTPWAIATLSEYTIPGKY